MIGQSGSNPNDALPTCHHRQIRHYLRVFPKQKNRTWAWIAAGLFALWLVSFQIRDLERYSGGSHDTKSLPSWIEWYGNDQSDPIHQRRAAEGIRNLRTNALPFLLAWLKYEGQPPDAGSGKNFEYERSQDAITAFDALDEVDTRPAVPTLVAMLNDTQHMVTATNANQALYVIARNGGVKATEALLSQLADTNRSDRLNVALEFGISTNLGAQSSVVALLIRCTEDHDKAVRMASANSLAKIAQRSNHPPAPLLVPVFAKCLQKTYAPRIHKNIMNGLSTYGRAATNAVPALLLATVSADEDMRLAATNALLSIAPEVLVNAPAQ